MTPLEQFSVLRESWEPGNLTFSFLVLELETLVAVARADIGGAAGTTAFYAWGQLEIINSGQSCIWTNSLLRWMTGQSLACLVLLAFGAYGSSFLTAACSSAEMLIDDARDYGYDGVLQGDQGCFEATLREGPTKLPGAAPPHASAHHSRLVVAVKTAPAVNATERFAAHPLKPEAAVRRGDEFLGPGLHTNIHPRTGVPDPDRLVSAGGLKSIRFGPHKMGSSPIKFHFCEGNWSCDAVNNVWNVDNVVVRVLFPEGAWW